MKIDTITQYPSIFNDVIGPVMRGPSSSHCAASVRIGRIARDLMDGNIRNIRISFDPNGSLATTHDAQGSDMGLFGGFLGWEAQDPRLPESHIHIEEAGINVDIVIESYGASHPNTYQMVLENGEEAHELTAISTGGGMIEVIAIDGAPVNMAGDYFETLVYATEGIEGIALFLQENLAADEIAVRIGPERSFVEIKGQAFPEEGVLYQLQAKFPGCVIKKIAPVLPVMSRKDLSVPFITCDEMLQYNVDKQLDLWELAVHYESARGNISGEEVFEKMRTIVRIMKNSIQEGLAGTEYEDRILGCQSKGFQEKMARGQLLDGGMLNRIILYITAMMEVKSSMGIIVAAPTAGSCAALPGTLIAAVETMDVSEELLVKGMLAAGIIGVFITTHATFAAEVGGCQAECGSGSGMAAAGLVTMAGSDTAHALSAASMALQSTLGMICDPIANRVEAPCLGRNVIAGSNALSCANMALADFDALIPLDEVIETMDKVGQNMPNEVCCTALGGLSITKTSKEIEKRLSEKKGCFNCQC